jgi:hypothetical protein
MKYSIKEIDGKPTLLRNGKVCRNNIGRPTNAELEFWNRIQELENYLTRDDLDSIEKNQCKL